MSLQPVVQSPVVEPPAEQAGFRARLDRAAAWVRPWVRLFGLLLGCAVFLLVVVTPYDRAVTVSGRTEVIEVEADGSDFSSWGFRDATVMDAAEEPSEAGSVTIELSRSASARFVRRGKGPLLIGFVAEARADGCNPVGTIARGDATPAPLCEDTRIRVALGDTPLVASLRGVVTVGEEARAGAGAQPLLLDGSAQLLVRHGGVAFHMICELVPTLCERFAATRAEFSLGDSLSFHREKGVPEATGFFRLDPAESRGGLRFDLAAANAGLEVRRMKGDKFELSESLFDRIAKSPVLQALNVTLLALSLVWWFVRAPGDVRTGAGGGMMSVVLVAALLLAHPARAQQAFFKSGEIGQALLRSRADRCYAITPAHVMGAEGKAFLTLERRAQAEAELRTLVPAAPEAMAFLLTRAVPPDLCPAFTAVPALDGLLRARANAVLRIVREDGSFDRVPLTVLSVAVETFEVQPRDPGQAFSQGMSGGTVLVDDQAAGLLTDVRDEGRVGRVARLDRVFERLLPYLSSSLATPDAAPAQAGGTGEPAGLSVVRWTAEPVTLNNRADQLLTQGGAPWRVTERVASVIFGLAPDRAVPTAVVIDAAGLPDPPRAVEVLLGGSERGPWRSVASFALEPGDTTRRQTIAPSHATFVMLRASGHQSGQAAMALGRFGMESRPK